MTASRVRAAAASRVARRGKATTRPPDRAGNSNARRVPAHRNHPARAPQATAFPAALPARGPRPAGSSRPSRAAASRRLADHPPMHEVARVVELHPGEPLECARGNEIIVSPADDGRIRTEARKNGILNHGHPKLYNRTGVRRKQRCRRESDGRMPESCRAQGERASRPLRDWKSYRSDVHHTGGTPMPPGKIREVATFGHPRCARIGPRGSRPA